MLHNSSGGIVGENLSLTRISLTIDLKCSIGNVLWFVFMFVRHFVSSLHIVSSGILKWLWSFVFVSRSVKILTPKNVSFPWKSFFKYIHCFFFSVWILFRRKIKIITSGYIKSYSLAWFGSICIIGIRVIHSFLVCSGAPLFFFICNEKSNDLQFLWDMLSFRK